MSCNCRGGVNQGVMPTSPCGSTCHSCGGTSCTGNCGSSGCGTCRCTPHSYQSSPTPFYNQAGGCQESHNQLLINERYSPALKVTSSFCAPHAAPTTIVIPNLTNIVIGSFLWNGKTGVDAVYLQVISFDYASSTVTVVNNDTTTPCFDACSYFVVTDGPSTSSGGGSGTTPYVAVAFTAPNNGDCLLITVTTSTGLVAGKTIMINGGIYRISQINSLTSITICNDGAGLTPGSVVSPVQDGSGNYLYPITLLDVDPCTATPAITGNLLICNNNTVKPLTSSIQGQVPVSNADGSFTAQLVDIPVVYCSPIDVCCWSIEPGVTTYTISVASNAGFTVGNIIQFNDPAVYGWRGTVTNVNADGHHITFTLTNTPAAFINVAAGVAICVSTCCEQLNNKIDTFIATITTPCSATFKGLVDAIRISDSTSNSITIITPGTLVRAAGDISLYSDGGTIDQWCYVDLANPSTCMNARISLTATFWALLDLVGVTKPFMYYSMRPNYGYEIIPIANAFTNNFLAASGNLYTEVEPIIQRLPAVLQSDGAAEEPSLIASEFPLSVFTPEHVIPAANKIRVAIRTNVAINSIGNETDSQVIVQKTGTRILASINSVAI